MTTFTQQQSIAGATSPLVTLRSSAIIALPSPHSSLPTPVFPLSSPLLSPLHLVWFVVVLSHRRGVLPRCAASLQFVSSYCRVSYCRVSYRRFAVSSPLVAPTLFGSGCSVVVRYFLLSRSLLLLLVRPLVLVFACRCVLSRHRVASRCRNASCLAATSH